MRVSDRVLREAVGMQPPELGSLDAIHIARAHEMGTSVRRIVTYDERMIEATKAGGLSVASLSAA